MINDINSPILTTMKKRFIKTIAISLIISSFWSCEKETIIEHESPQINFHTSLKNDIITFRKEILQPDSRKSGETFSIDSAIILMEASFNFHHGLYNRNYSKVQYDTIIIETNYDSNANLTFDEVRSLYVDLNNMTYDLFLECTFNNKVLKFIDISFSREMGNNQIKALVAIGNSGIQKKASKVKNSNSTNSIWLNEVKFLYTINKWEVSNSHNNTVYVLPSQESKTLYLTNTEIALALNNAIELEYGNSSEYIYLINKESIRTRPNSENSQVIPVFLQSVYIDNQHIAKPDAFDVHPNNLFFQHYGRFDNSAQKWYYLKYTKNISSNNYNIPESNYTFMNKYYNTCLALVEYHKPYHKEAIDLVFMVELYEVPASPQFKRSLSGALDIYYAQSVPDPYHNLFSLEIIK